MTDHNERTPLLREEGAADVVNVQQTSDDRSQPAFTPPTETGPESVENTVNSSQGTEKPPVHPHIALLERNREYNLKRGEIVDRVQISILFVLLIIDTVNFSILLHGELTEGKADSWSCCGSQSNSGLAFGQISNRTRDGWCLTDDELNPWTRDAENCMLEKVGYNVTAYLCESEQLQAVTDAFLTQMITFISAKLATLFIIFAYRVLLRAIQWKTKEQLTVCGALRANKEDTKCDRTLSSIFMWALLIFNIFGTLYINSNRSAMTVSLCDADLAHYNACSAMRGECDFTYRTMDPHAEEFKYPLMLSMVIASLKIISKLFFFCLHKNKKHWWPEKRAVIPTSRRGHVVNHNAHLYGGATAPPQTYQQADMYGHQPSPTAQYGHSQPYHAHHAPVQHTHAPPNVFQHAHAHGHGHGHDHGHGQGQPIYYGRHDPYAVSHQPHASVNRVAGTVDNPQMGAPPPGM